MIWPESSRAGAGGAGSGVHLREALVATSTRLRVSSLVGSSHRDEADACSTPRFSTRPIPACGARRKVHLVPYGEFTPWRQPLDFSTATSR